MSESYDAKVVFMRSKPKGPPYCICCGDKDVPHAHIYNHHLEFVGRDRGFGLTLERIKDAEQDFLRKHPEAEGKTVTVTFTIKEEERDG